MGLARYLRKGIKLYLWLLVTTVTGVVAWLIVRSAGGTVGGTIGWAAFFGIVAISVVVLAAIRRAVRLTTRGI